MWGLNRSLPLARGLFSCLDLFYLFNYPLFRMTNTIKDAEFRYWNQPGAKAQHELIAGPVKWEDSEACVSSHWDMITHKVELPKDSRVLEIGCGLGRILKWLSKNKEFKLTGVDISPNMLVGAKDYINDASVNLLLVEDEVLPLPDNSQDFVYSFLVFQHIPTRARIKRYLSEIHRVLKPSGQTRIQTHRGKPHPENTYGFTHGCFYPTVVEFADDFTAAGLTVTYRHDGDWLWVGARK